MTICVRALGRCTAAALAFAVVGNAAASAATLSEADMAGGEFSASYASPTKVGVGIDAIRGTGSVSSDDYFHFTDLLPGAQSFTFDFSTPLEVGHGYSAGGTILFDSKPFGWEWAGTALSPEIRLDYYTRSQQITLSLPDDFLGDLWLALNFTHGDGISYGISAKAGTKPGDEFALADAPITGALQARPDVSEASPVPVPPAAVLLGSALLGMGGIRRRSRRPAA